MRFLLILLLFILLYQLLVRYLFPYLVKKMIKKAQKQQSDRFNKNRNEGDVNIKWTPPGATKSKFQPDSVEDVDFEEIKDK